MTGPKLLDKKIVSAEVASQTKRQIDAGISIAKKVDAVRETLQEEEQNLETFRTFTLRQVQTEIDASIKERDNVKDEIVVLERNKQIASIPLDVEWKKVHEENAKLLKDRIIADEKSFNLKEREQEIERAEQEIENDKGRAKSLKQRALEALLKADSVLTEARESAADIRNQTHSKLLLAEVQEMETNRIKKEVEEYEKSVLIRENKLIDWETDLKNREKKLKDQYDTLQRTINRVQNGRRSNRR